MPIQWRALALSLAGAVGLVGFWGTVLSWRPLANLPEIALVMVAGAGAGFLHGRPSLRRQEPLIGAVLACLAWFALRTVLPHGANWDIILSYATVIGYFASDPMPSRAALRLWAGRIALIFGILLALLAIWRQA